MIKNYRDQEYLIKVGKRIVEIRKEKGITQEKLAELCELEVRQIGRIERAETNATISIVKAIGTALDVQASEILDFD
ncbi:helix-turn-helix transcriptional regulator [Pedobacter nyackensis]|uniref:helix-turn-helix domain-containing protein n=1 Tax=Pedobacter nyackensis TaxID=475255 RepID=UPI00292D1C5A|nr:helix-turn-helix transcriptional regulator [Pedobacter nyackensis]